MKTYAPLYAQLELLGAAPWVNRLPEQLKLAFAPEAHRNFLLWQNLIQQLPDITPTVRHLNQDVVHIGAQTDLSPAQQTALLNILQQFHPWRKGPFNIFGIHIDTEWHSDWKWQRLVDHIAPLEKRAVLDVGCGNGYHCWRMYGAGAKLVVGVDPTLLSVMQFEVVKTLHGVAPVYVLPLGVEALPNSLHCFDTVFSMGVLYHRRSPIDHLLELRDCLQPGGELVLETLVIEGIRGEVLVPEGRYAKMRNVWFIPSVDTLLTWLQRCGFKNSRVVDINQTTIAEQRSTEWMTFHSLQDFLHPNNPNMTCEGLPAPRRAIFIANS